MLACEVGCVERIANDVGVPELAIDSLTCFSFGQLSDRSECFLRTSAVTASAVSRNRQTRAGPVLRRRFDLIRGRQCTGSECVIEMITTALRPVRPKVSHEGRIIGHERKLRSPRPTTDFGQLNSPKLDKLPRVSHLRN